MESPFLTARWSSLAMLNYEVPAELVRPLVPRGLELDTFQNRNLVSMVGFLFEDTRVMGIPAFFHRSFEEVNLRFYVRRKRPEGWVRGVIFIKEIVPKWLVATLANSIYHENYVAMPMRHQIEAAPAARYEWRFQNRWNALCVRASGDPYLPRPGSEEEFITEHYWGYAAHPSRAAMEYHVTHPQWQVWRAEASLLDADIGGLYGAQFTPYLQGEPSSAFLATGSAIAVLHGHSIEAVDPD